MMVLNVFSSSQNTLKLLTAGAPHGFTMLPRPPGQLFRLLVQNTDLRHCLQPMRITGSAVAMQSCKAHSKINRK